MSRSFDERILWYFFRSVSSSTLFMIILAGLIILFGLVKEDGMIFLCLGVLFLLIACWQVYRGYFTHVQGEEVDASAEKFMRNIQFEKNVMTELSLSEEELKTMNRVVLDGYCCFGIETEPLYRWDEKDQRARSSNYQMTCLCMDRNFLLAYSVVKSLIDAEFVESSHIWNVNDLEYAEIRNVHRDCSVDATKGSDIRKVGFGVLVVRTGKREEFAFAIGLEQMDMAKSVVDYVMKFKSKNSRLRMPGAKMTGGESPLMQWKDLSKRQKAAFQIGHIEDVFIDLRKSQYK